MKFNVGRAAFAAFLLASVLPAQEPAKSSSSPKDQQETTLTGCLNKGSSQASYVLTNPNTGSSTVVTGPAELEQHAANHTVKLTGSRMTEGGRAVFKATKIEHISATCSQPGKKE